MQNTPISCSKNRLVAEVNTSVFAAGFLYGIQKGLSPEESAEIGNKSAAHVISEIGVRPIKNF